MQAARAAVLRDSASAWAEVECGFRADPWQAAAMDSRARNTLWMASRQAGKSSVASVLAVHTAVWSPGSLVLLLSPGLRQSGELFRKCLSAYRAAGQPVKPEAETRLTLDLSNGSRIVSLPGNDETVRGYSSVSLIVMDEAARVGDELIASVRPMLAVSRGKLVALSTPWGRRGWFFDAWENGGPGWERVKVTADQCPRITPEFLAEERRQLPPHLYASEYMCEFVESESSVFPYEMVRGMFSDDVSPLFARAAGPLASTLSDDVQPLSAGAM